MSNLKRGGNGTTNGPIPSIEVLTRDDLAALRDARRTNMTTKLDRVAIVGGTHGNETTGLFVVQHFMAAPAVVKR